ncbi:MAG: hypothetical protein ACK5L7_11035 [Paludibacteraceae bacterium]
MQNSDNIYDKDDFGESIKKKLKNYQIPPDKSAWQDIEKRLEQKQNKTLPLWWLWTGGGIAASLALLLLFNPIKQTNSNQTVTTNNVSEKTLPSQTMISAFDKSEKQEVEDKRGKNYIGNNQIKIDGVKNNNSKNITASQTKTTDINKTNTIETNTIVESPKNHTSTEFQANEVRHRVVNSDLQQKDSIPADNTEPKLASLPEIPEIFDAPEQKIKKNREKKWALIAQTGTYGKANIDFSSKGEFAAEPTNLSANKMYGIKISQLSYQTDAYIIDPSQFSDIEHLPPFSGSILLQKGLSKELSISSGLIYTYLRSNYSYVNRFSTAKASLELHYLGIPLNLNILLADKNKWKFYLSAGGAVEKGLRSTYKQSIKYQNSEQNTDVHSNIEGLQTSINTSLGISYNLDKNWSLYFEPKIIYYFNNNQPMSARTETPINAGFNGGLVFVL